MQREKICDETKANKAWAVEKMNCMQLSWERFEDKITVLNLPLDLNIYYVKSYPLIK